MEPDERLTEAREHLPTIEIFVLFGLVVLNFFFLTDWMDKGWGNFLQLGALLFSFSIAGGLSYFLWHMVVLWLGQIDLSRAGAFVEPKRFSRTMEAFSETWWNHQFLLDVFWIVLRLSSGFGLFFLLRALFRAF